MSGLELIADDIDGRLYAAVMRQGRMTDLYADAAGTTTGGFGAIYLGRVKKVDTRLNAAIVDLGSKVEGYLPAKYACAADRGASENRPGIGSILRAGQMIPVQVRAEAKRGSLHEQHKMPRLTMFLRLDGQFVCHGPNAAQVTVSKKIENEKILKMTSRLKGPGGWLVQEAAGTAEEEDILFEVESLRAEWQKIDSLIATSDETPRLLRAAPNAVIRALNDYGAAAFDNIHAGTRDIMLHVGGWAEKHMPALAESKRLRLFRPEVRGQRLCDIHDIEADLQALEEKYVALPCGGSIIIDVTHALITIDVNQGSAANIVTVNQEAAQEAMRQIRLRNLSGAILIDFVGMRHKQERAHIIKIMETLAAQDVCQTEVHGFTRLGILEITRKRRSASLAEKSRVVLAK
jgi:ribonuclease E/ribonuclease G